MGEAAVSGSAIGSEPPMTDRPLAGERLLLSVAAPDTWPPRDARGIGDRYRPVRAMGSIKLLRDSFPWYAAKPALASGESLVTLFSDRFLQRDLLR